MIDPLVIKKSYAVMSDAELLAFAKREGSNLTPIAFEILKTEIRKRNLSAETISQIEDGSYNEEQASLGRIIKIVPDHASTTALAMAINEKRDGKSNEQILYHLMDQGLDEDQSRLIIDEIRPRAQALLSKANAAILTSIFIAFAGIALKLISPEKSFVTFLDIAATCTLIFGLLRFLKGYLDHNKFKTVLRNLSEDDAKSSPSDEK